MNSKITLGVIAILLVAGGGYVIATSGKALDTVSESTTTTPTSTPSIGANTNGTTTESSPKPAGEFASYDASKLAYADKGDVVLFFSASWCPTCQQANNNFNASSAPNGLTVLKLDYDTSTELKKKYGVTTQHTFVQVDARGNLIKKWSLSDTYAELQAQVN